LTKKYAEHGFGEVVDISEHAASDITKEVYWVDSDPGMLGHCTPLNTILLNKEEFEGLSEETADSVFLHEVGHTRPGFFLRLLFYLLVIPAAFIALLSPFVAVSAIVAVFQQTGSFYSTVLAAVGGSISVALMSLPAVLLIWIDEGYAERFTLNQVGEEKYLRASEELRQKADRGLIKRLFHLLRYPPPGVIVWISKKF